VTIGSVLLVYQLLQQNTCRGDWGPCTALADADEIQELIRKVQNNEAVPQAQERLISRAQPWAAPAPKH